MKNIFKTIMGVVMILALICMITKGYKSLDIAVAFIGMAITSNVVIDGLDYIIDKAKGE